jgi:hypothetical protein
MTINVSHRPEQLRFEAAPGGKLALCNYRLDDKVMTIHHTEVPWQLQGKGVAAELVQATLAWARAEGLHVRPTCSYVASYMRRHPDTHDLLYKPGDAA